MHGFQLDFIYKRVHFLSCPQKYDYFLQVKGKPIWYFDESLSTLGIKCLFESTVWNYWWYYFRSVQIINLCRYTSEKCMWAMLTLIIMSEHSLMNLNSFRSASELMNKCSLYLTVSGVQLINWTNKDSLPVRDPSVTS